MILTATIAFALKLFDSPHFGFGVENWLYQTYEYASAAILGVFLASIIWICLQRVRTGRFFHHPGHWLLGADMLTALATIGFWSALWYSQIEFTNEEQLDAYSRIYVFYCLVSAGVSVLGAGILIWAARSNERRWLIPMLLLALRSLAIAFAWACYGVYFLESFKPYSAYLMAEKVRAGNNIVMVCAAIAICIAVSIGLRKKVTRDWLHWLGLSATLISLTAMPLLQYLYIKSVNAR